MSMLALSPFHPRILTKLSESSGDGDTSSVFPARNAVVGARPISGSVTSTINRGPLGDCPGRGSAAQLIRWAGSASVVGCSRPRSTTSSPVCQ
jgi:hypothetical protein